MVDFSRQEQKTFLMLQTARGLSKKEIYDSLSDATAFCRTMSFLTASRFIDRYREEVRDALLYRHEMYQARLNMVRELDAGMAEASRTPPPPPPPPRRPVRRHLGELQLVDSDEEGQRMVDPLVVENRRVRPRNPRRHLNRQYRHHPHYHPHQPPRPRYVVVDSAADSQNANTSAASQDTDSAPMFQVYYQQPEPPQRVPRDDDNIEIDDVEEEEDDDVFVNPPQQEVPQDVRRRQPIRRRRRSSGSGVRHMRICG